MRILTLSGIIFASILIAGSSKAGVGKAGGLSSPEAFARAAAAYRKTQAELRVRAAVLLEQSLRANLSPSGLQRAFRLKAGRGTPAFFQSQERLGQFAVQRSGANLAFQDGKATHLLSVDSVYPALVVTMDGLRISPPPGGLKGWADDFLAAPAVKPGTRPAAGGWGDFRFSLVPEARAQDVVTQGIVKEMINAGEVNAFTMGTQALSLGAKGLIGGALFGVAGLVEGAVGIYQTSRLATATENLDKTARLGFADVSAKLGQLTAGNAAVNRTMQEIDGDLKQMHALQARLAKVQIPALEMDISDKLRKAGDDHGAQGMQEMAQAESGNLLEGMYGSLLGSLQRVVDREGSGTRMSCKPRSEKPPYVELVTSINGSIFRLARGKMAEGVDQVSSSFGNVKVDQRDSIPASVNQFHPLKATVGQIKTCVDQQCKSSRSGDDSFAGAGNAAHAALASQAFAQAVTPAGSDLASTGLKPAAFEGIMKRAQEEKEKADGSLKVLGNFDFDKFTDFIYKASERMEENGGTPNAKLDCGAKFLNGYVYSWNKVFRQWGTYENGTPKGDYEWERKFRPGFHGSPEAKSYYATFARAIDAVLKDRGQAAPDVAAGMGSLREDDPCAYRLAVSMAKFHVGENSAALADYAKTEKSWSKVFAEAQPWKAEFVAQYKKTAAPVQARFAAFTVARDAAKKFEDWKAALAGKPLDPDLSAKGTAILASLQQAREDALKAIQDSDPAQAEAFKADWEKAGIAGIENTLAKGVQATVAMAGKLNDFSNLSICCASKYCSAQLNRFFADRAALESDEGLPPPEGREKKGL